MPTHGQKCGERRGKCCSLTGHGSLDRRSPTTPQHDAGKRIDPPKSVPQSNSAMPLATAHAAPPELPPAERVSSYGLRVGPDEVVVALPRERQVRAVALAQQHRARLAQGREHGGGALGDALAVAPRAAGGGDAGRVPRVLERVGHAGEGAPAIAAPRLRLGQHVHQRAEATVAVPDGPAGLVERRHGRGQLRRARAGVGVIG